MNKSLATIACISAIGFGVSSALADAPTSCSLATLHGTYAFAGVAEKAGVPHSSSGMEAYDGQGHSKYYELWSDGYTQHKWVGTGTYTITANCIATVIYDGDSTDVWTYFVAPDGSGFYFNNNLGLGAVGAGQENRISRALLIQ